MSPGPVESTAVYTIDLPRKSNGKIDFSSSDHSVQLLKHLKRALLKNDDDIVLNTRNRDEFVGLPSAATLEFDEEVNGDHALWIHFDYETETIDELHYWYGPKPYSGNFKTYHLRRLTYKLIRIGKVEIYFKRGVGVVISKRGNWWPEDTEETPLDALRRLTLRF
jgi:hypothetical protein